MYKKTYDETVDEQPFYIPILEDWLGRTVLDQLVPKLEKDRVKNSYKTAVEQPHQMVNPKDITVFLL